MKILILLIVMMSVSCTHVRSISQTSIPAKKGKIVKAEVEKHIIFLFQFSTDYVNELNQKLVDQCPNGSVQGILTKDTSITYFPLIWHKDHVIAEGYCNE